MVIFWLVVGIFVIALVLMYIFSKKIDKYYDEEKKRKLFKTLELISTIVLYLSFFLGFAMIMNKPSRQYIQTTRDDYYELKSRISEFSNLDPDCKKYLMSTYLDLEKDIKDINYKITYNRGKERSFFRVMYSEEIGNLEELKYE